MTVPLSCALCAGTLADVTPPRAWPGITSDNRPWPAPGPLAVCEGCGHVQKAMTGDWQADVARVYADYALYHLSGGVEQVIFTADAVDTKSARVLDRFLAQSPLPADGTLLDVGCGTGSLLRAFHARRPRWRLHGHEQDARGREAILAQPAVEGFHTGPVDAIDGTFDLVTVVHVFEHVFYPVGLLARLRERLAPGGQVLVQVPDAGQNPFDLMVVDHRSHFLAAQLAAAAGAAGYRVETLATGWIAKEITAILRPAGGPQPVNTDAAVGRAMVADAFGWLQRNVCLASELSATPQGLGIFGTANAATWLASVPGIDVKYFVDEDPNRIGKTHLGRPIVAPADAPANAPVLLAFPTAQAIDVRRRLAARAPGPDWRTV